MYPVIILIILIIVYYLVDYMFPVYNWRHKAPRKRYTDVYKEFGSPTFRYNYPGGAAGWFNKGCFEKIMLVDESIEHLKPKPHCDFLYATVKCYIPFEYIMDVLSMSESVKYDQLKNTLTARCHFMGANVATLVLCVSIANHPEHTDMYLSRYGDLVMESMDPKTYKDLRKELKELVKENHKIYDGKFTKRDCVM
mgnify:CR=1 FL=1